MGMNSFESFLLFELNVFDVILGMDWLAENLTNILYGRKMVCIIPPGIKLFVVYGDKSIEKFGIIMMMTARRCLSKGFSAFLAYAIDTKNEKRTMNDIPVV